MNRLFPVLALSLAASACAGASSSRSGTSSGASSGLATVNEKGEKIVCRMERPIGSNIAEMVCRTQESIDAQRQSTQDALRAMPKNQPPQRGN